MAIRPILSIPDATLRRIAEPVAAVDDGIRALAADMLETMYDAPGIGLAAPQIGVLQRVIVLDVAKRRSAGEGGGQGADEEADEGGGQGAGEAEAVKPEPMVLVNPVVTWMSADTSVYEEGCLSIPEYYEEVVRPASVRVSYLDRDGNPREVEAGGILATCLQHEIDHLDGVLFIDHISRLKRSRVVKKFEKAARGGSEEPRRARG